MLICVIVCHLYHSFSLPQDLGRSEEAEAFHSKALAAMAAFLISMSSFIMPVPCCFSNSPEFIFPDTLKLSLELFYVDARQRTLVAAARKPLPASWTWQHVVMCKAGRKYFRPSLC